MRMLKHTWYIRNDLLIDLDNGNEMDRVDECLRTVLGTERFHTVRHVQSGIEGEVWNVHSIWIVDV